MVFRFGFLLCLASVVLAVHAPGSEAATNVSSRIHDALRTLKPVAVARLDRRQSTSDALDGLQGLLTKAVEGQANGQCASECSAWVDYLYDCSEASSYTQIGICACGTDQTAEMRTCGSCYGGDDEQGANDFSDYCATVLDSISSLTSASSASATAASRTSNALSVSSVGSSVGGGILSDLGSTSRATTSAAQATASTTRATTGAAQVTSSSQGAPSQVADSAAVNVHGNVVALAAAAAVVGGTLAAFAL